ncbi:hypothetical protein CsSME_00051665 [Camellia sinensis var. sinensis]
MAESATTDTSETLVEVEPSTQDMDLETPIAATEEQLPAADSKHRLDQLEGTEGDKESDRVSFLHYWPSNVNVNKDEICLKPVGD